MATVDGESEVSPCEATGIADVTHRRYEETIFDLLPRGDAWSRDDDGLRSIVNSMAVEPSRLDNHLGLLLSRELDPSKTIDLLDEWEATYGLPECEGVVPSSDDMRRLILAEKVRAEVGHDQSYTWWAEALGNVGYPLLFWEVGPPVMTCVDDCIDVLADEEWPFVSWQGLENGNDDAAVECFVGAYKLGGLLQQVWWVWTLVYSDAGTIRGMAGPSNGHMVAVGESGLIRRSTSDWTVWTSPTAPPGTEDMRAVAAGGLEGNVLITCGTAETGALISLDGGETWEFSKMLGTDELHAVTRGEGQTFVAVGDSGEIWRSTDEGDSWGSVATPTANSLRGAARGDGVILAVGASATVIRSTTDGAAFSTVANPAPGLLSGVACFGLTAIAVGDAGYVMRSDDGGATWADVDAVTVEDLHGVTGSSRGRWTAVGDSGTVIQSFDDGATWQLMGEETSEDLHAVAVQFHYGHAVAGGTTATIILE